YVVRLTANDGQYTVSDEINVDVCSERDMPLDVVFLLDVSGSMEGPALENSRLAIRRFVSEMRFNQGPDSDAIGIALLGDSALLGNSVIPPGEVSETQLGDSLHKEIFQQGRMGMPLSRDPALVDRYMNSAEGWEEFEDFEPQLGWAISSLKNDLKTRDARPLIVVISDYGISRRFDEDGNTLIAPDADAELIRLGEVARQSGIRVVTIGFNAKQSEMIKIASTYDEANPDSDDVFPLDNISEIPSILGSLRRSCQGNNKPLATFAYDDRRLANSPSQISYQLEGRILDFRTPFQVNDQPVVARWVKINGPGDITIVTPTPSPTAAGTEIRIAGAGAGTVREYILELQAEFVAGTPITRNQVTIRVQDNPANQAPICKWERIEVDEDASGVSLPVLLNDFDPDGDSLYIASVELGPNLHGLDYFHGGVVISGDHLVYSPDRNFNSGTREADGWNWPQVIRYTVIDRPLTPQGTIPSDAAQSTGLVVVHVIQKDDLPIANDDNLAVDRTVPAAQTLNVLANDLNVDGDEVDQSGDNGLIITDKSVLSPQMGTLSIATDKKSLLYTSDPSAVANYTVTFTYTIRDPHGSTATAQVTLLADEDPNHPPVAVADTKTVWVGTTPILNVLENDYDPNPGQSVAINSITTISVPGVSSPDWKDFFDNDGTMPNYPLKFYPKKLDGTGPGNLGDYKFSYTIIDNGATPLESAPATITIKLVQPGPLPIAVDNNDVEVARNSTTGVEIPVLANDLPFPGLSIVNTPTYPQTTTHGGIVNKINVNGEDRLVYIPATGFYGPDSFTYTVQD
ncbi:MAG: Ig-like domain-containing protein, partial [Fimbriimonadaceae bacterium]